MILTQPFDEESTLVDSKAKFAFEIYVPGVG
jgi:hypothetical protein